MTTVLSQPTYRLSDQELTLWLKFIEHQVGFVLPSSQQNWIRGIIERYLFKLDLGHSQFFEQVSNNEAVFHEFFDEILIPRTQFFRYQASFDLVADYAKSWKHRIYNPENQAGEMQNQAGEMQTSSLNQSFTIWSVGSATGQEPVSLAMTLTEVFLPVTRFWVWASDYHQQAILAAKQGRYDLSELAFIPMPYHRWLQSADEQRFAISPLLLDRIGYFSFNLMQRQTTLPVLPKQCQVIMCQNVLIYFRQFEQRDILHYLSQYLADDGMLMLGVGEASHITSPTLLKIPSTKADVLVKTTAPDWVKQLVLD